MKTNAIKKGKPAARKTGKTVDPLKDRTRQKVDENVCKESEAEVIERLCCCEDVYC